MIVRVEIIYYVMFLTNKRILNLELSTISGCIVC